PFMLKTIEWTGEACRLLDQTKLPTETVYVDITDEKRMWDAIRRLVVRGAPAIGVAAAYAVALAAARSTAGSVEVLREDVTRAGVGLAAARPTAVNLPWAVTQMGEEAARPHRDVAALREALRAKAEAIHADEVDRCVRIGEHGAGLLRAGAQVLTHCNAGALATGGFGTALGVIRAAHRRDPGLHVWIDETRPLFQGARLTAWELQQEDIPATLITDSTAAWLMAERKVDAIVTGADRIARNGDTANKIGTYGLAVLARAHGLPFYVAAPTSTIDPAIESGRDIPIEHRRPEEVAAGAARGVGVYNPAFDVTPAEYVSAIVTERGVHRPPYLFS
ncbi:MAG TPA: S-methyl-5-thioribose-1-phosphate isomerase, partial [Gaiellales bacterium]|nr:S-methyl-5-thioribose-1-phosphate isomerase [Gaiellales bacterium]